jgi:hypothetical protein
MVAKWRLVAYPQRSGMPQEWSGKLSDDEREQAFGR